MSVELPPPAPVTGLRGLDALLDKAVTIPSGVVHEHVMRLRRRYPHASPAEVLALLDKQYVLAVSAQGGAVGAAAAAPAIGTGVGIALTASEVAAFFATSAAYGLAVASVHGIEVTDVPRRRTLLLATLLGDQGRALVTHEAGLPAATGSWARSVLTGLPSSTIKRVNHALARRWVKRYAAREGALAVGRLLPFGVGAVIGATGARAMGRTMVTSARTAFGPPPERFPLVLELDAEVVDGLVLDGGVLDGGVLDGGVLDAADAAQARISDSPGA